MMNTLLSLVQASCFLSFAFGWHPPKPNGGLLKSSGPLYSVDSLVQSSSCADAVYNHETIHDATVPQMVPISNPPLLLLQSETSIISKEECTLLTNYFEQDKTILEAAKVEEAEGILHRVRGIVDTVTNCPSHAEEMQMPRYVRYDANKISVDTFLSPEFVDVILPDGLHVDTNNGKLFRHITAILYLTDNENGPSFNYDVSDDGKLFDNRAVLVGGGTAFPLAEQFGSQATTCISECDKATRLLSKGIQHTKAVNDGCNNADQRDLEQMAVSMLYRDINKNFGPMKEYADVATKLSSGLRVMPKAGKLIYFHNIGDDGIPDPTSFHGGEELALINGQPTFESEDLHKSILVFFKEIPIEKIQDFTAFATEVQRAREWTMQTYYLN